jgi:hypothetical protein
MPEGRPSTLKPRLGTLVAPIASEPVEHIHPSVVGERDALLNVRAAHSVALHLLVLGIVPLLGSLITEPASTALSP